MTNRLPDKYPDKRSAAAAEFDEAVRGCMFAVFDALGVFKLEAWLQHILEGRRR